MKCHRTPKTMHSKVRNNDVFLVLKKVKVKVKHSRSRPGVAQRVPGS